MDFGGGSLGSDSPSTSVGSVDGGAGWALRSVMSLLGLLYLDCISATDSSLCAVDSWGDLWPSRPALP